MNLPTLVCDQPSDQVAGRAASVSLQMHSGFQAAQKEGVDNRRHTNTGSRPNPCTHTTTRITAYVVDFLSFLHCILCHFVSFYDVLIHTYIITLNTLNTYIHTCIHTYTHTYIRTQRTQRTQRT